MKKHRGIQKAPIGWKTVDPRGYVLVKMPAHHRADVRGYVYEHVLVAEQKLGRPLLDHEEVHHKDEHKSNNEPSNLIIASSAFAHHVHHRKNPSSRQLPLEPNTLIECACGCGVLFAKFDGGGRPRRYVSGHNDHPNPTQAMILASLRGDMPVHRGDIVQMTGLSPSVVAACLSKLGRQGKVLHVSRGLWALPGDREEVVPNA
jgi:hypothetical protein